MCELIATCVIKTELFLLFKRQCTVGKRLDVEHT